MTVPWEGYELRGIGRQRAVDLFDQEIAFAVLERRETITLPLFAAKVILACARDGQHRGQGRHHPPDSEMDRIAKATVVDYARARWREHGWRHGTKLLAAQEVLHEKRGTKNLARRVNFTAEYLTRLMGPKPEA